MWRDDLYGPLGAVDYSFRITRTEVTNTQYFEFIDLYTKTPGAVGRPGIWGSGIWVDGYDPRGDPILSIRPGFEQIAANPSFEYAARYANWLHNGRGMRQEDFDTGVYDMSTFGVDPVTGERTDQIARSSGATFFIPTIHEWTKAVHYDPDRYGPGEEGYWTYPDGGEDLLVAGPPGDPGAETSAGIVFTHGVDWVEVGQYPDVTSPWGLLDASGGFEEVTESVSDMHRRYRFAAGSSFTALDLSLEDRLDWYTQARPGNSTGFRIASVVPAPSGVAVFVTTFIVYGSSRRRKS